MNGWLARRWAKFNWLNLGNIPEDQIIWRSVFNSSHIKSTGELKSGYFKGKGLSCDVAILTNKETARRGFAEPPWPETAGLVQFKVRDVLELCGEGIEHKPLITERGHKHYSHAQFKKKLTDSQADKMKAKVTFPVRPTFHVED